MGKTKGRALVLAGIRADGDDPYPLPRRQVRTQWAIDTSGEHKAHVRLPLRGQLRFGCHGQLARLSS